ncbi:unnamed protein product [Cylicocyclus nassatus]|uniref:Uncharacterized protein n=1 Tax=Cylicocyclus nassatus TaxID=53992 RepID=A0AA36H021_CYLNA|nr:unnamed protein product [Cylicocyclus nassatus]
MGMWTLSIASIILFIVLRAEARPQLDFHYANDSPRSLKSFWHLSNRGRVLGQLFSNLNLKRPQRAVSSISDQSAAPTESPTEFRPCVCHYMYFSTTYCYGDCDVY